MSLANKPLDDEWDALAAREASSVASTYARPRFGAAAAASYQNQNPLSQSATKQLVSSPGRLTRGDGVNSRGAEADERAKRSVVLKTDTSISVEDPSSSGVGKGAMLRVPSQPYPTVEDAVFAAKDGDCIFLEPSTYRFTEPVLITKNIHIIGLDEVGTCAVLAMNGGILKPPLPLLRVSNARVHLKGITIQYSHDEERATVDSVTQAFSIFVSDGGSVVLDEVNIQSSCGGIRGTALGKPSSSSSLSSPSHQDYSSVLGARGSDADGLGMGNDFEGPRGTYITATCCRFECDTTAVQVEGQAFIDRCTVAVGARGITVQDLASAKIEGSGFVGGAIGVEVLQRGRALVERNAFVDVAIGVNIYNSKIGIPQPSLVRGNEFRNPTETAVRTDGEGATADVCKNLVHGFTNRLASGLEVRGGKPELLSNVIRDCLGTSIALLGGAPLVESNVLELGRVGICVRGSRPTIRLNEICLQQEAGVVVESTAIPYTHGLDPEAAVAAGLIAGARSNSSAVEGDHLTPAGATSANTSSRIPLSDASSSIIHPLQEADPHVEANNFHDNTCNLRVNCVTGTFLKNDFGVSQMDNVVFDGPLIVPIVLSGNLINGSKEGCAVLAANGVEAHITDNMISGAKVACIMLKGSRFCEVKGNVLRESQTAFVAMDRSLGRVTGNEMEDGMAVDVYTDSQPTVTVVQ